MEEYKLPDLRYAYNALEPIIDEQTMRLHHGKHHAAYVNGLNAALLKMADARTKNDYTYVRALCLAVAFHGSGHMLHSLFWESMCEKGKCIEPKSGTLFDQMVSDFGSLDSFKRQFSEAAKAVEGSGWAILAYEPSGKKLVVLQAENHQKQSFQGATPILALDVWEHAYYLKYQNRRADYVDAWWNICDWEGAERRLAEAKR